MKLFFQTYGKGFPLVILHGLFGSHDNWHTMSRKLAGHFKVHALDLRNHGNSPHSEVFTYSALAEDVKEFFDNEGLSSAFMIGHSMGGKTAMRFTLDHPDLLRRLVLVDIAPKEYIGDHDYILDALTNLDLRRFTSRRDIDAALAVAIPAFTTRQFLLKNLNRAEDGSFQWKMNLQAIKDHYDEMNKRIDSVRPFTRPTLLLRSTKSGYVEPGDLAGTRSLFPNITVVDLDVGHWIHAEAPEKFTTIVLDFFLQTD